MANEIYTSISFTANKNGAKSSISSSFNLTMTGNEMIQATQVIGTSSELITLGDISGAPGYFIIKNLDSTNYIEIGGDTGLTVFKLKLKPGQHHAFQPSAAAIYAKANTASVRVQVIATEI
jgi:C4-dicarboxylate-specific signal transduction histidine kinase